MTPKPSLFPVLVGSLALVSGLHAGPFVPDRDTLFLASFDRHADRADYAHGWDRFGGGGYTSVEGYYGKAVDLRGIVLPEDFWKVENGFYPHFTQWIFWPRGNVDFRQGTMECWFRVAPKGTRFNHLTGSDLLHFQSFQPLAARTTADGKKQVVQPFIKVNTDHLSWKLVTLNGEILEGRVDFSKVPGWRKKLSPERWHHFAFQWAPEGVAFYIDGRLAGTHVLNNNAGIAITGPTQRGLGVGSVVLDEFRISARPRYGNEFEPNWREGARPAGAFPGAPHNGEVAWKERPATAPLEVARPRIGQPAAIPLGAWKLGLDDKLGLLANLAKGDLRLSSGNQAAGLLLFKGVEREALLPQAVRDWKATGNAITFAQEWRDSLQLEHKITEGKQGELRWHVTFRNNGSERLWLEALFALPAFANTTEFFDMSWTQQQLPWKRRRDEYIFSLPFAAASNGKQGIGVGLDPHQGFSALIGEWLPKGEAQSEPMIRQGTRVVLAPGEVQSLEFVIVTSTGDFGVRDTLVAYHELSPDLYRFDPLVPIYSYLPVCQYFSYVNLPDLTRVFYSGGQWGHGPYHTKGDYLGDYWGRKELEGREDYQHALDNQRRYKTVEGLKKEIVQRSRDAYFYYYTPRRSHDLPNMPARFILEDLMPGESFPDDPLSVGQYFAPKNYVANEYRTPLGRKAIADQWGVAELIGKWSPGFINDFCQSSNFRFTDAEALKSPGRAFSEDRGEYLVGAFGSIERYKALGDFVASGKKQTVISDWGMISYMLSAYSPANSFESGCPFVSTTGMQLGLEVSRNLLGEKPISVLTSYGLDNIGHHFQPGEFTPERLRDYYRYSFRRVMLTAIRTGYYADPPLLHGKQWNSEVNPILVESLVYGRKTIAGARVNEPLWVVQGGSGNKAILVVGNTTASPQESPVSILPRYTGGSMIWAPYFGGSLAQTVSASETVLNKLPVPAHDLAALKPVAHFTSPAAAEVQARWEGDGLAIRIRLEIDQKAPGTLQILSPSELYEVAEITCNGKKVSGPLDLPKGRHTVEAVLQNTVLAFSGEAWKQFSILKDGAPNFCLISKGAPSFDFGTAAQLNWFLMQYDEEDGVLNNLPEAPIYADETAIPANFQGWKLDLRPDPAHSKARVTLNPETRTIRFEGATPGEVRRGMMVFMRQVDRTLPHIGRHVPMDRMLKTGWKIPGWHGKYDESEPGWKRLYTRRPATSKFFEEFEDKQFLQKPILEREYEPLYANGNVDFAGKYTLRNAPYLFEPTFTEDFIYGYPKTGE